MAVFRYACMPIILHLKLEAKFVRVAAVITDFARFEAAMARFDAANAEDPNTEVLQGTGYPKELQIGRAHV